MIAKPSSISVEEVTDAEALAKARLRREQFERNMDWFRPNAAAIYAANRGKHICIAGGELFRADSAQEALAQARAAHPEDEGRFTLYVPHEALERVYATRRPMDAMP
jgi:hypothetical protein